MEGNNLTNAQDLQINEVHFKESSFFLKYCTNIPVSLLCFVNIN